MQKPEYKLAKKIDLEIRQLTEQEAPLTPGKYYQGIVSVMLVIYGPIPRLQTFMQL